MKKIFLVALLALISCGKGEEANLGNTSKESFEEVFATMSFVKIPSGSFIMGSPEEEKNRESDEVQVSVEISRAFEMMEAEVTQSQYFAVMGKNPSQFKGSEYCSNYDKLNNMCPDHPVEKVSWNEVQKFIKNLNEFKGLKGCKGVPGDPSGCYRLPTEAEWEYAVRAGSKTVYFFGDDESQLKNYAVYLDRHTRQVKSKNPNPYGLYDMYGNVWEWVQDTYQSSLPGGKDPLVTSGTGRVLRGSRWSHEAKYSRSANRYHLRHQHYSYDLVGFRLVRAL